MNTSTGQLVPSSFVDGLSQEQQKQFIQTKRDLTVKEASDRQIRLYSPCSCGSGKKFKFCCKT